MVAELASRKIFAGPRPKRLRRERRLTQARMADELDVSPSYLNLMESNQRPITGQVLVRLADVYGVDPRDFAEIEGEYCLADLEQVLADPLFHDDPIPGAQLRDAAQTSPALLAAMLRLYHAYVGAREARASDLDLGAGRAEPAEDGPLAAARAILQGARNHFPEIDAAAESFAASLPLEGPGLFAALVDHLRARCGVRLRILPIEAMGERLRYYDHPRKQLIVCEILDQPSRVFQVAYQLALIEFGPLLDAAVARLGPGEETARRLLRISLANYFAAAVMMPYAAFHDAAELTGYDLELLAARFGASFEQVAHRLTTLSRPSARGVPFFLLRVDIAGNVSKRFSAGRSPFASAGGTCPLWSVHAAFASPGRILTQTVELPDGAQWFSIARAAPGLAAPWGAIAPRFAIGLGCELKYARRLVYGRRLDQDHPEATPIGLSCRLCGRQNCPQRAAPPARRQLLIDESTRNLSPFPFREG